MTSSRIIFDSMGYRYKPPTTPPSSHIRHFGTLPNTMRYDCSLTAVDEITPPLIPPWTLDISLLSVYYRCGRKT